MQTMHSGQDHCNEPTKQNVVPLSDLASIHLATSSSSAVDSLVQGEQVERDVGSLSAAGLSLTDFANLHTANLATLEEKSVQSHSTDLSLSELASMHMSAETDHFNYEDTSSVNLPLVEMNPQLASLDFTTGFTTPKTGSTLSLSQLASLGSTSGKSTILKPTFFQNNTGGLAALAAVHLNSLEDDSVTNSIELNSVKPLPGLLSSNISVVNSSQETPLASVVDKLTIQDTHINSANASVFASIVCMTERQKSRRLVERHRHLKRKFWRELINPHKTHTHIPIFTFTTSSPDDYVLKKQRQAFES